jgi:hypothetical protein
MVVEWKINHKLLQDKLMSCRYLKYISSFAVIFLMLSLAMFSTWMIVASVRCNRVRLDATWTPLTYGPHATTSPHDSCDRKSQDHDFNCRESFALRKPRMPKSRFSRFVPPVPSTINGSYEIGKSRLAISTCM